MFNVPAGQTIKKVRARFTDREVEYLEEKCGLHLNHLVRFVESILSGASSQDILIHEHKLRRAFLGDQR